MQSVSCDSLAQLFGITEAKEAPELAKVGRRNQYPDPSRYACLPRSAVTPRGAIHDTAKCPSLVLQPLNSAGQAGTMPASLDALPAETLDTICRFLCLHCQSDPSAFSHGTLLDRDTVASHRDTLAALSKSCKRLHHAAAPYLYHWPHPCPLRAIHLIRTLSERPDLAVHVKTLRFWHQHWHLHKEDVDIWGDGIQSFRNLVASREIVHAPTGDEHPCPRVDASWESDLVPDLCFHLIAGALALSYTPNIETVEIILLRDEAIPFARGTMLRHLRHLKLTGGYERHTEAPTLERVALLTPRLPALTVFKVSGFRIIRPPNFRHRTVTDLYLYDVTTGSREMEWLMSNSFVNVQLFSWTRSYVTVGGSIDSAAQEDILTIFKGKGGEVKHLHFEIEDWIDLSTAAERLRHLKGLQTLDIAGRFNDMSMDGDEEPDETYDSGSGQPMMRYANLLPPSIRAVSLGSRFYDQLLFGKDMMYLARHAREMFPQLEMVRLWGENAGDLPAERVREEFEANGVPVQRGEDNLWTYL